MPPSIAELLPSISDLSHAEKFQLVQIVLAQLAAEQGIKTPQSSSFDPRQFFGTTQHIQQLTVFKKSLRGTLKHYANPSLIDHEQTAWLNAVRDDHEPS